MKIRHEHVKLHGISDKFRIFHISDVHFSRSTSHEKNQQKTEAILQCCAEGADVICVTGDLVSRRCNEASLPDATELMRRLRKIAPVFYSMGNHESDLPEHVRVQLLHELEMIGITVLDNRSEQFAGVTFTGLTLPQTVYKNPDGSYLHLEKITQDMTAQCVGTCSAHPQILLAHSPIGFAAYAEWGADLVLAGHVHGGIVRLGNMGFLSPERRFIPKYTKGLYTDAVTGCVMNVSAGIGKFRMNNPAEVICITCERSDDRG